MELAKPRGCRKYLGRHDPALGERFCHLLDDWISLSSSWRSDRRNGRDAHACHSNALLAERFSFARPLPAIGMSRRHSRLVGIVVVNMWERIAPVMFA